MIEILKFYRDRGVTMSQNIIHGIVLIQTWGDDVEMMNFLKHDKHIVSVFHIMGRHSYLIDVNFDDKIQLAKWINSMKAVKLPSGVPVILSMQTEKIIRIVKQKNDYTLEDYNNNLNKSNFFVEIDCPSYSEELITILKESDIVTSILHVQGESSLIIEIFVEDYELYKNLLRKLKQINIITHIETKEVLSVVKFRNKIIDESGKLVTPGDDIREIFTL